MDSLTAAIARLTGIVKGMEIKTNGERTSENMTCRKVTGEKVTVEKEGWTMGHKRREVCDRWKDEGNKGSDSRTREVNNRDDDR